MSKWEPWQKMIMVLALLVGNLIVWLDAFEAATELRVSLGLALALALAWAGIRRTPPTVLFALCLMPFSALNVGCAGVTHIETSASSCWAINGWNVCVDGQLGEGVAGCVDIWPVESDKSLAFEFCGGAEPVENELPAEPVNDDEE